MAGIALELDATGSAVGGGNPSGTAYAFSSANGYQTTRFDAPEPEEEIQWAGSVDTEGMLRASSKPANRQVTIGLRLAKSTDALLQTELNTLGKKIGVLRRDGGTLKFTTPAGTVGYFDILSGGHAFNWDSRLISSKRAEVTISLPCAPYIRGPEEDLGDNTETTLPALIFTEASIKGDVPALGRLVIDDDSAVSQWWMTWGLESRYYSSSANAALFYEAEGRTALGGSAIAAGPSGASGAGSNVMRNTALTNSYLAILSTQATAAGAHLSHVGTFRVYARVQVPTANTGEVTVALEWSEADFLRASTNTPTTIPTAHEGQWRLVDLGLVSPRAVTSGTQRWEGRIIAKSTVVGDDIDVDYLLLIPVAEGSGIASGVLRSVTPTAYVGEDHFTSTTAGNALNARVAPTGGTWATSGDATDLAFDDDADPVTGAPGEHLKRTATGGTNGRWAILGSTNYINAQVDVRVNYDGGGASWSLDQGVIARWTDSSNYLRASFERVTDASTVYTKTLKITQVVAGTATTIASATFSASIGSSVQWWKVRLAVDSGGNATAAVLADVNDDGHAMGQVMATCSGTSSALATGGTLATGKPGIWDRTTTAAATTRYYDDFLVSSTASDAAAFASQSIEVRYDRVQREDSAGALWAPVSSYEGDYLKLPPSGAEARTLRVIVKMSAADPLVLDPAIGDLSARLFATARYLNVPSA